MLASATSVAASNAASSWTNVAATEMAKAFQHDGLVRNAVNVPRAPQLSGQERVDYIMRQWREMPYEQKLDPKYSISAPYWHAVVDAEYDARRNGVFLPNAAREPTPELFASDDDRSDGEDDDDPELPDLPLPPAGASWSTVSPSPEKGAPDEAGEASHQSRLGMPPQ